MINTVVLMGRLVADPELRMSPHKRAYVLFRLAVDRSYGKEDTDFISCVAWQKTAEFIAKYFHKGDMIAVEGELHSRQYDDADGKRRTSYDVNVDRASFCGSKSEMKGAAPDVAVDDYDDAAAEFING